MNQLAQAASTPAEGQKPENLASWVDSVAAADVDCWLAEGFLLEAWPNITATSSWLLSLPPQLSPVIALPRSLCRMSRARDLSLRFDFHFSGGRLSNSHSLVRLPGKGQGISSHLPPSGFTLPLNLEEMTVAIQLITPFLWFDQQAEEAANFYVSIFPNSKIVKVLRCGEAGPWPVGTVLTVEFLLDGQKFVAMNGGPNVEFNNSVSFVVNCRTQVEVDSYWSRLTAGGAEVQCGWLKDKFGLSWQITPEVLPELISSPDPKKAERAMKAMMGMVKIDIAALKQAVQG